MIVILHWRRRRRKKKKPMKKRGHRISTCVILALVRVQHWTNTKQKKKHLLFMLFIFWPINVMKSPLNMIYICISGAVNTFVVILFHVYLFSCCYIPHQFLFNDLVVLLILLQARLRKCQRCFDIIHILNRSKKAIFCDMLLCIFFCSLLFII